MIKYYIFLVKRQINNFNNSSDTITYSLVRLQDFSGSEIEEEAESFLLNYMSDKSNKGKKLTILKIYES